jgi:hypothetical protein
MSVAEREANSQSLKISQSQDNREASARRFTIDPDLATACAFATTALLLAAYVAIKFPQWSEAWAW